jgi:hypothetical protein
MATEGARGHLDIFPPRALCLDVLSNLSSIPAYSGAMWTRTSTVCSELSVSDVAEVPNKVHVCFSENRQNEAVPAYSE